jgi:hypothetical protein
MRSRLIHSIIAAALCFGFTQPKLNADNADKPSYVAHEWGTFTTFSGSDGVFMEFRPLADRQSDLPAFVWDRTTHRSSPWLTKGHIRGRVRMETPVIYFYTDTVQNVNVKVDFPQGLLTEFFPPVQSMSPPLDWEAAYSEGELIGNSSLDWGTVTLMPATSLVPSTIKGDSRQQLANYFEENLVPNSDDCPHYAYARNTDAALVHVQALDMPSFRGDEREQASFVEKFLFYRGVGKFDLPLKANFDKSDRPLLKNLGSDAINAAVMIEVRNETISISDVVRINAMDSYDFKQLMPTDRESVKRAVQQILNNEGLYEKEAASMVATWDDSWFTEQGSRILYTVPTGLIDKVLPLQLDPAPQQLVRTLIGRMELLSPTDEVTATQAVAASFKVWNEQYERGEKENVLEIPQSIERFGRLAEPTLARVATISKDANIRLHSERLRAQMLQ